MERVVINEVLYVQSQTLESKCLDIMEDDERQCLHAPTQLTLNPYKRLVKDDSIYSRFVYRALEPCMYAVFKYQIF